MKQFLFVNSLRLLLLLLVVVATKGVDGFIIPSSTPPQSTPLSKGQIQFMSRGTSSISSSINDTAERDGRHQHQYQQAKQYSSKADINNRRGFIDRIVSGGTAVVVLLSSVPSPAIAMAKISQEEIDKSNVVKGYTRLQYLLDNWEQETTVCGMGGDKLERSCDRTPLKVMDYMGYRSTTDPLYKAEKTLRRLYEDSTIPTKRDAEFVEAVETFAENVDAASGAAFVSSWGESNPGGGKDRVELFIERSRLNIVAARNSLATIIDILDLKQ